MGHMDDVVIVFVVVVYVGLVVASAAWLYRRQHRGPLHG
jgi:hypothetical protein